MGEQRIACAIHGETAATFMCRHLVRGVACGYHASAEHPGEPWPDAWCDGCDAVYQAQGGTWDAVSEGHAEIEVLCTGCYEAARERNRRVPPLARGTSVRLTGDEAEALFHGAIHLGQEAQDRSNRRWGWLDLPRWDFDDDAGTLRFSDPGRPGDAVVADVDLVGSFSTRSNTFQWSWATDPDGALQTRVAALKVFGEVRGMDRLAQPNFSCEEVDAWEMAALARYVLGAEGIYRPPFDHLYWFMLVRNLRRAA
jgi:hypothetical protein